MSNQQSASSRETSQSPDAPGRVREFKVELDLEYTHYFVSLSNKEESQLLRESLIGDYRHHTKELAVKAAEWRLRVARQKAICRKLDELGPLAHLVAGPLLVTCTGNRINCLERDSRRKVTFWESPMRYEISHPAQQALLRTGFDDYVKLETAIKAFGHMLCLSVEDLHDPEICSSMNRLKIWCVEYAFRSERHMDGVCQYLKFLAKVAQSWLLKAEMPSPPDIEFRPEFKGKLEPFVGELKFISDGFISDKRRTIELSLREARACAQLANTTRALPFPSTSQSKESIVKTVDTMQQRPEVLRSDLTKYQAGLRIEESFLKGVSKTHSSLVASGCVESSRTNGGRGAFLVREARQLTDLPWREGRNLEGFRDQFGFLIIDPVSFQMFEELEISHPGERQPCLGDLLYLKPEETPELWALASQQASVPRYLGHVLNWTASMLVMSIGTFTNQVGSFKGFPLFQQVGHYKLIGQIKVRADVSIEAGMKTRLITLATAGFAHLSQLPSNLMREYLSQDPFCRVGFEEADKLWEVLKTYRKHYEELEAKRKSSFA